MVLRKLRTKDNYSILDIRIKRDPPVPQGQFLDGDALIPCIINMEFLHAEFLHACRVEISKKFQRPQRLGFMSLILFGFCESRGVATKTEH